MDDTHVIAALHAELAAYERRGDTERADAVREQLRARGVRGQDVDGEERTATSPAPERRPGRRTRTRSRRS